MSESPSQTPAASPQSLITPPLAATGAPTQSTLASPDADTLTFRYAAALANTIEARWQDQWRADGTYRTPNPGEPGFDASRPKKFVLDMFPYPSGAGIHVGHPLGYIATDIYARYLRMTGHNVLHAMGFDSFGLPAEQYALATNTHPRITTEKNIEIMQRQLRRLGLGHDDRRGVSTTDETFYKWTQWIFLQIYNSYFDAALNCARPIKELIKQFAYLERPTHNTKPWGQMNPVERAAELDRHRLAYVDEVPVNWCPMLGTVLANEEVTAEGTSERGNFPVYKRPLKQWVMRITAYNERLLKDLEPLHWPEAVKNMQRNWIGRSEGAYVDFPAGNRRLRVFTTRPDTLFGATYLVLSPEHTAVDQLVSEKYAGAASEPKVRAIFPGSEELIAAGAAPRDLIAAYRAYAASKTDEQRQEGMTRGLEKTGVFIGAYAISPVSEARLPIFIADYVLSGYGTGAIMAVPAHDDRDFEFATAFGLPIVHVVQPVSADTGAATAAATGANDAGPPCFTGEGVAINSPPTSNGQSAGTRGSLPIENFAINGMPTETAKLFMADALERFGRGKRHINYKLRDWLFSRQRYWGEPFPMVYDAWGQARDLPEAMLPVLLPDMENFQPESSTDPNAPPRPPLARAQAWTTAHLDLDGRGEARYTRETNTMPNWAGSCWYYLRYIDPQNYDSFVGAEAEKYWMTSMKADGTPHTGGVDLYVGGVEHAVLHLLYARFWHKVLFDLGHVSTPEPFGRLFNQGYIQAEAFVDSRGMYVPATEVAQGPEVSVEVDRLTLRSGETEPVMRSTTYSHEGQPVFREYGKMGKSLKNAVAPDEVCAEYGCDTLRLYEMAMGPLEASKPWNTRDIAGSYRFLQRVWRLMIDENTGVCKVSDDAPDDATRKLVDRTIAAVGKDLESLSFNTAIAKLIELTNELTKAFAARPLPRRTAEALTLMLAPLAPHIAEELWHKLGHTSTIVFAHFPTFDPAMLVDDSVELPVQINGKVRARIMVATDADDETVRAAALAHEEVAKWIEGKPLKMCKIIKGKMVTLAV